MKTNNEGLPYNMEVDVDVSTQEILRETLNDSVVERTLRKHNKNKIKMETEMYTCNICGKDFKDKYGLRTHQQIHSGDTYSCDMCDYVCKNKKYLTRHKQSHGAPQFPCEECGRKFKRKITLQVHMRTHTGEKPYECDVCGKAFSSQWSFNNHKRIHTDEKPFACDYCDYRCRDSSTLTKHKRRHTNTQRKYQCSACYRTFYDKWRMKQHVAEVHLHIDIKVHECDVCQKRFKCKSTLASHIKIVHARENKSSCDICGAVISSKYNMNAHILTHVRHKAYKCTFEGCDKRYKTPNDLNRHMPVHIISRQHACDVCQRRFTRIGRMRRHLLTHHTKYKLFECDYCGAKFYNKKYISKHIRQVHTEPARYECDACGFITSNKPSIVMHCKYGHNNDHDRTCKVCNKKFKRFIYLKLHYWRVHSIRYKYCIRKTKERKEMKEETVKSESDMLVVVKQEVIDEEDEKHLTLAYSESVLSEDLSKALTASDAIQLSELLSSNEVRSVRDIPEELFDKFQMKTIVETVKDEKLETITTDDKKLKNNVTQSLTDKKHFKKNKTTIKTKDKKRLNKKGTKLVNKDKKQLKKKNSELVSIDKKQLKKKYTELVTTDKKQLSKKEAELVNIDKSQLEKKDTELVTTDKKQLKQKETEKISIDKKRLRKKDAEFVSIDKKLLEKNTTTINKLLVDARRDKLYIILEKTRKLYNEKLKQIKLMRDNSKKDEVKIRFYNKNKEKDDEIQKNNNSSITNDNTDESNHYEQQSPSIEIDTKINKVKLNTHQCNVCLQLFDTKAKLLDHCKEHFDICNDVMLKKCPICDHVASNKLAVHMKTKHNIYVKLHANYKIKNTATTESSKYYIHALNKNIDIDIIPSVKNLNRTAGLKLDKEKREAKDRLVAAKKLVKKGKEWVVEEKEIDLNLQSIPEFDENHLRHLSGKTLMRVAEGSYLDNLYLLSRFTKKRGHKMVYPCNECDKICQNFSGLKLHSRKHDPNKKPFKPKVWKHKTKDTKKINNPSLTKSDEKEAINNKEHRNIEPKPVTYKHRCNPELIEFYNNNIKGGNIEFWQFLKIYNKMDKDNVNTFNDISGHDNPIDEANTRKELESEKKQNKRRKVRNNFTRVVRLSKREFAKRKEMKNELRNRLKCRS